ncbi:MAG: DUF2007 domain-containing protein [Candidatus Puniceispirillaceae bacterium]
MEHLVSTTNGVRLSFLLALLADAGIEAVVFDANISALEAGIGAFPRRVMVPAERRLAAKTLLEDAGEFFDD